jgi:two-component system phosphate regulon sensor histidine kinase PhoR
MLQERLANQGNSSFPVEDLYSALDAVDVMVCAVDSCLQITSVYGSTSLLAASPNSLKNSNLLDWIPEGHRQEVQAAYEAILAGELGEACFEIEYAKPSGQRWLTLKIKPSYNSDGVVGSAIAVWRDATPVQQLTRNLEHQQRQAQHWRLLSRVSEHLSGDRDQQSIIQFVTKALVEDLGVAFARIWLFESATSELVLCSSAGLYTTLNGQFSRITLGQSVVGKIAASRRPITINDVASEPELGDPEWAVANGIQSFAGYPLIARNRLLGVLAFFHHEPLTDEQVKLLEPLARQVALALEQAQFCVAQHTVQHNAQTLASIATTRAMQLSATLAAMTDGVWACDRRGRLLMINDAAFSMLGLRPRDVQLARLDDLPDLFEDDCTAREAGFGLPLALRGETIRTELMLHLRVSKRKPMTVAVTATPMTDDAGRVMGAVAVVRDITQHKAMENMKDNFLSVAAHELKTPVTALKGYTQLALRRLRTSEDQTRLERPLQTIGEQAERIAHLVDNFLDVSRIQDGHLELYCQPFDLVETVRESIEQYRQTAPWHRLELNAPRLLPIVADRMRITQVIENLLDNAIKYSPVGSAVQVAIERSAREVKVVVHDDGIGIAKDKLAYVFEPWYQAHAEQHGDVGGMGLGLSIAHEIVERHGGSMWVESTEGKGSSFGFKLPLDL